jgi:uncharacterized protein (TIGR04222 family)
MNMDAYLFYLVYVGAVAAFSVLLLRRQKKRPNRPEPPQVLEVALLRGGLGAVAETIVFDLHLRNLVELKADKQNMKVMATISSGKEQLLSQQEQAALIAFEAVQKKGDAIKKARQQIIESFQALETEMKKAGWWKKPTRWKWSLTVFSPAMIVFGCFRFIGLYEGGMQVALALTVPVFAVLVRRVILHELTGPTENGRRVLRCLREERDAVRHPLMQMALQGSQGLKDITEYRSFFFMTRGVPYGRL